MAASPKFQAWRDEMHKAGLSQKQFDQAFGSMLSLGLAQREGAAGLDEKGAVAALREGWKTDAEFNTNIRAAYRAAEAYGDVTAIMTKYGNDPDVIRILANVGKELAEDTSAGGGASGDKTTEMEIQSLTASPAYFNPADPQHATVNARVTAFYDRKYGTGPKSSGSVSIGQVG